MAPVWGLLLRLVLKALLRRIVLEAANCSIQYTQCGEPGPWNMGEPAKTADAARLDIRALTLTPAERVKPTASAQGGQRLHISYSAWV